jgi:hypothetical protein
MARLSAEARVRLERRREELRLVEAELRADEVMRLQDGDRERPALERGRLRARWGVGLGWRRLTQGRALERFLGAG